MTRIASPLIALALVLAARPALAHEEPARDRALDDVPETTPADEADFDEEELAFGEEEFCGGEEPTIADVAAMELSDGNAEEAKRLLVQALREGHIFRFQRAYALMTLAEAQLVLGEHAPAARNYARALREDPEVGAPARVGLAAALAGLGREERALEASREAAEIACDDVYAKVECYAAQLLVATSSAPAAERDEALETARILRAAHADYVESFEAVEERLGLALPEAEGAS